MAELNLIPSYMKSKAERKSKKKNTYLLLIIILAIAFFSFYIPGYILQQFQNKEKALKLQVDAQYYIIEERNQMESQISKTNELVTAVDTFGQSRQLIYEDILNLQGLVSNDLTLNTISYAQGIITIDGITNNFDTPTVFAANLQETEVYKNAKLMTVATTDSGYAFNITITLE